MLMLLQIAFFPLDLFWKRREEEYQASCTEQALAVD